MSVSPPTRIMADNSRKQNDSGENAQADADDHSPECGREMRSGVETISGNGETYIALVTANILRLRREWELAEAKCSEVLSQDPENAAACSVMGDITRDQGKLRDAIEWYKMALDRNPGSAGDRKKLEALIDEVFAARQEGAAKRAVSAISRGLSAAVADVRSARPHGALALVIGVLLLAILLVSISTVLVGRRPEPEQPGKQQIGAGSFRQPGIGESNREKRPAKPPRMAAEAPPDLLAREPELLSRLKEEAKRMDPNCEIQQVEIDPRDASVDVHFSMPRVWPQAAMRDSAIRAVGFLAGTVGGWDERVPMVRTRGSLRGPGGPERVAVVAESRKDQLPKLAGAGPRETERLVSSIWWAPELRGQ